tara:strand:- start:413 stop:817 length:405 start_codon:yes stop_codon:yes gene_type:complete
MEYTHLLYFLLFVFGYITCRVFYFIGGARKSIQLIHLTQLVALFITVKGLENFHYSYQYRLNVLKESKASAQNLKAFNLQFEDEVALYKKRTIEKMITAHGSFFNHLVTFEDWKSGMKFLEDNREEVINFMVED